MRVNDIVSGTILIAAAAAMVAYTRTFPSFPGQHYGPDLFPRILGVLLIIFGGLLVVRGLRARVAGAPLVSAPEWATRASGLVSVGLVLGVILAFVLFQNVIGFIPLGIVSLVGLFLWFGVKPLQAGLIGVASILIIHWFFSSLMRVPLPRGLLDPFL